MGSEGRKPITLADAARMVHRNAANIEKSMAAEREREARENQCHDCDRLALAESLLREVELACTRTYGTSYVSSDLRDRIVAFNKGCGHGQ